MISHRIPACAGSTTANCAPNCWTADHPRMGGEQTLTMPWLQLTSGQPCDMPPEGVITA
jgi:hypothetical protein